MRTGAFILLMFVSGTVAGADRSVVWEPRDGNDFYWGVAFNGCIFSGTAEVYNGGSLPVIDNNRHDVTPVGDLVFTEVKKSADGREIEVGPWDVKDKAIQVRRRIRVSATEGWCRWIDTYSNVSSSDQEFAVDYQTDLRFPIAVLENAAGANLVEANGTCFLTKDDPDSPRPALCHFFAAGGDTLRPVVTAGKGAVVLHYQYKLKVPAGKTVALCFFESQQASLASAREFLKSFDPPKELADVEPQLRAIIANMGAFQGAPLPGLERSETADLVILDANKMQGAIANETFEMRTRAALVAMPAAQVVGAAACPDANELLLLRTDGQVIRGSLGPAMLKLQLTGGESLQIPFRSCKYWSFRIDKGRPQGILPARPMATLRSGEQLCINLKKQVVRLGGQRMNLDSNGLAKIVFDGNGGDCRVFFANGSRLTAVMEWGDAPLEFTLGVPVKTNEILSLNLRDIRPDPSQARVELSSGERLIGQFSESEQMIRLRYGESNVDPIGVSHVRRLSRDPNGLAHIDLWGGPPAVGSLTTAELSFEIANGPQIKISTTQITEMDCPSAPPALVREVDKLVVQLGSDRYKERDGASEALYRMGPSIAPLLEKHQDSDDEEVRMRIKLLLERFSGHASIRG